MREISPERKKLIERITKLFALADSTEHKEEAENARRIAVELMARHNITAAENLDKEDFSVIRKRSGFKRRHMEDTYVINAVAKLNNVFFVSGKQEHIFSGRPSDIAAMEYMLDLVMQQRIRAYSDYKASLGLMNPERNKWLMSFALGVIEKVRNLREQVDQKQREWALVPVSIGKQAKAHYASECGRTHSGKRSTVGWNSAGYEAGKSVSLSRGVDGSGSRRYLGYSG